MTMFTLFWAGDTYAPKLPIQHFLQDQYLAFVKSLAERVKHNNNILAIATMNELSKGYIGNTKLDKLTGNVKLDFMPTPLQGFALADGKAVNITKRHKTINKPDSLVSRIHSIEFYDSIVAFFVNDENSRPGETVSNNGKRTNAKDFRNKDLSRIQLFIRAIRKGLSLKLRKLMKYRLIKTLFRILVATVYWIENYAIDRKFRRFF